MNGPPRAASSRWRAAGEPPQAVSRLICAGIRSVTEFSSSEHWTLNLRERMLHLNIGLVEVLTLVEGRVALAALPAAWPPKARERLEEAVCLWEWVRTPILASSASRVDLHPVDIDPVEDLLRAGLTAMIPRWTAIRN